MCVCHKPLLCHNGSVDRAGFFYRFPSTYAALFLREIRLSRKIRVVLELCNFVPDSGLRKFGRDISTVVKCDLNKQQPSVYC